jgi:hypothetical protein
LLQNGYTPVQLAVQRACVFKMTQAKKLQEIKQVVQTLLEKKAGSRTEVGGWDAFDGRMHVRMNSVTV